MTQISKKLILELRTIIKEEYRKEMPIPEISEIANSLVEYFDLLAKIHHRDKSDKKYSE